MKFETAKVILVLGPWTLDGERKGNVVVLFVSPMPIAHSAKLN